MCKTPQPLPLTPPQGDPIKKSSTVTLHGGVEPGLAFNKTVEAPNTNELKVGDVIVYHFELENTDNCTLTDLVINDPMPGLSAITLPTTTLAPGEKTSARAEYTVTEEDVARGFIENQATATGNTPGGTPTTTSSTATIKVKTPKPNKTPLPKAPDASSTLGLLYAALSSGLIAAGGLFRRQ